MGTDFLKWGVSLFHEYSCDHPFLNGNCTFVRGALVIMQRIYHILVSYLYLRWIDISKEHLQSYIWVVPSLFWKATCNDLIFSNVLCFSETAQQTFQRCFNVVFWLTQHRDVGQRQINIETTLCISMLKFTSNNVESMLRISTLTWTTSDNIETTLPFSTSSFTTLVNVETTLWKWQLLKRTKKLPEKFK